jgi:hypothetical protein
LILIYWASPSCFLGPTGCGSRRCDFLFAFHKIDDPQLVIFKASPT